MHYSFLLMHVTCLLQIHSHMCSKSESVAEQGGDVRFYCESFWNQTSLTTVLFFLCTNYL